MEIFFLFVVIFKVDSGVCMASSLGSFQGNYVNDITRLYHYSFRGGEERSVKKYDLQLHYKTWVTREFFLEQLVYPLSPKKMLARNT